MGEPGNPTTGIRTHDTYPTRTSGLDSYLYINKLLGKELQLPASLHLAASTDPQRNGNTLPSHAPRYTPSTGLTRRLTLVSASAWQLMRMGARGRVDGWVRDRKAHAGGTYSPLPTDPHPTPAHLQPLPYRPPCQRLARPAGQRLFIGPKHHGQSRPPRRAPSGHMARVLKDPPPKPCSPAGAPAHRTAPPHLQPLPDGPPR